MQKQYSIKNKFEKDFIYPGKYNHIYQNRQVLKEIYDKLYRVAM